MTRHALPSHGWSWTPGTTAPQPVRIRRVEHRFDFFDRGIAYDGQTGEARPDVQQASPDAPGDTGFHIGTPFLHAHTPTPEYTCAYALVGDTERLLGCTLP